MPFVMIAYLCLGVVFQCALYTPHPDWTAALTWMHILLWPGFVADWIAVHLHQATLSVSWLTVALTALLLAPLPGMWLAWRQARSRERAAGIRQAIERSHQTNATLGERIEPRLDLV